MLTRRFFLRRSAIAMTGAGSAPLWLARAASTPGAKKKILIAIFQRGAADGLNIVIPFAEKRYYEFRPTINIPVPSASNAPNTAIDLDGRFALHPSLQPLKALWDKQQLAIVEATGSPDNSRSHFDAQDHMESGTPGKTGDGWLNRALSPQAPGISIPLRAIAVSSELPRSLRGERPAIAISNLQAFQTGNADIMESLYASSADPRLAAVGKDAFAAMKMVKSIGAASPQTPNAAYAQGGALGNSLRQIAQLIKADAGVEVAFAEMGGWDHHGQEPGQIANQLRQFGAALAAFSQDMGDRMEDIVVVTMSEFGRTAKENGNQGTDHGHGSLMFVLGGNVAGGKIYGTWPGLEPEQLYENRDLAVTTDYRTVLSELISSQLGQTDAKRVFPGYSPTAPLGLLKT